MTNRMFLAATIIAVALPFAVHAQSASPEPPTAAAAPSAASAPRSNPAMDAVRAKFRAACGIDIAKHCKDVLPDGPTTAATTPEQVKGRRSNLRACLASHSADLTLDCKTAITEREAAWQARKS